MDCVFAPLSNLDAGFPRVPLQGSVPGAMPTVSSVNAARALLESAAVALEAAFDVLFSPAAQAQGTRAGTGFQRAAMHRCLKSATGLLDISQILLLESSAPCQVALPIAWRRLADEATAAGRAGFAVLTLSDPIPRRPVDPHAASH